MGIAANPPTTSATTAVSEVDRGRNFIIASVTILAVRADKKDRGTVVPTCNKPG
jgi:hypothetical protein